MSILQNLLNKFEYIKSEFISLYKRKPILTTAVISFGVAFEILKIKNIYQSRILQFPLNNIELNKRIVLITGCSSGIGKALALGLNKFGFTVIATCRRDKSIQEYLNNNEFIKNGSTCLKLDVTSKDDILKIKQDIATIMNDTGKILWGIINNAGYVNAFLFECISNDALKREININMFGGINVTHTLLPLLYGRQNKLANNTGFQYIVVHLYMCLCFYIIYYMNYIYYFRSKWR